MYVCSYLVECLVRGCLFFTTMTAITTHAIKHMITIATTAPAITGSGDELEDDDEEEEPVMAESSDITNN